MPTYQGQLLWNLWDVKKKNVIISNYTPEAKVHNGLERREDTGAKHCVLYQYLHSD